MARREENAIDRELADLAPSSRWREWMRRVEAVLFASRSPVGRDDLTRVVGQGASVDLLIEDLAVDLEGRPYEVAQVGAGWMLRTRAAYAPAILAAARPTPLSPPRPSWPPSGWSPCATCRTPSNRTMRVWQTRRGPRKVWRPARLQKEIGDPYEAGSLPAAGRPDPAALERRPAPAPQSQ